MFKKASRRFGPSMPNSSDTAEDSTVCGTGGVSHMIYRDGFWPVFTPFTLTFGASCRAWLVELKESCSFYPLLAFRVAQR